VLGVFPDSGNDTCMTEAITHDYHMELDTISHEAKHLLAYQCMSSVRWPLAGLHLSRM